jgi:glycosyltransferase involved in cell wall biosynthesis
MPQKILIVMPTQGKIGGLEINLIASLAELKKDPSIEVSVCLKLIHADALHPELIRLYKDYDLQISFFKQITWQLIKQIHQADLIHFHNLPIDIVILAVLLQKPTLATIHHYFKADKNVRWIFWKWCSYLVDSVCFISDFVCEKWIQGGFLRSSIKVYSSPIKNESQHIVKKGLQRKGFLFISRLIPQKGLDILLRAYQKANLDSKMWPLYVVGEGPLKEWAELFVKEYQLAGVSFLGFVNESEKVNIMSTVKWIVVPPSENEDLGLTPIEGRLCSTPIIISQSGGLPEAAGKACISSIPNSDESLKEKLVEAAKMSEEEYGIYTQACERSLDVFFQAPIIYKKLYVLLYKV